jgi:hypothetical protein
VVSTTKPPPVSVIFYPPSDPRCNVKDDMFTTFRWLDGVNKRLDMRIPRPCCKSKLVILDLHSIRSKTQFGEVECHRSLRRCFEFADDSCVANEHFRSIAERCSIDGHFIAGLVNDVFGGNSPGLGEEGILRSREGCFIKGILRQLLGGS